MVSVDKEMDEGSSRTFFVNLLVANYLNLEVGCLA